MTRARSWLAALAGCVLASFVLGFMAGHWLGSPAPGPVRAAVEVSREQAPASSATSSSADELEPRQATPRRGEAELARPDRSQLTSESEALAAEFQAPELSELRGEGVLRGSVHDREGVPLPDVRITVHPPSASRTSIRKGSSFAGDRDSRALAAALQQAARRWAESEGLARETRTDQRGEFELRGLPRRTLTLSGEAEGWSIEAQGSSLVEPGDVVELVGTRLSTFRLELSAADGTPITQARIDLSGERYELVEWTAGDPTVSALGDELGLRAFAEIYEDLSRKHRTFGRLTSREIFVHPAPDGSTVVRLELEPTCVLLVKVHGELKSNERTFLLPLRDGEEFDPSAQLMDHTQVWAQDNRSVYSDLAPGTYVVGVLGEKKLPLRYEIIEVQYGLNRVLLESPELDKGRFVQARSFAPDGGQLRSVEYVFEWSRQGQGRSSEWVTTHHGVDGVDLISLDNFYSFDIDDWPRDTEMWLTAESQVFGRVSVPYTKGQQRAEFHFSEPSVLRVSIRGDIAGGGYAVAIYPATKQVGIYPDPLRIAHQRPRGGSNGITSSGKVEFRGLSPGEVIVKLERRLRGWGGRIEIDQRRLMLRGGAEELQFQAPRLSDLTVEISPHESGRLVSLLAPDEDAEDGTRHLVSLETRDEGRVVYRGLPPGDYYLVDRKTGARRQVEVPSAPVAWDLSAYDLELTVALSDAAGKLAEWGLQGGDRIVALNGAPLEDSAALLDHLHAAPATITVVRGEERLELELPVYPRDIRIREPLGGRLFVDN